MKKIHPTQTADAIARQTKDAQCIIDEHNRLWPESRYFAPSIMRMFGDTVENFEVIGPGKAVPITPAKTEQTVYGLKRISPTTVNGIPLPSTVWLNAETFLIVTNVLKLV